MPSAEHDRVMPALAQHGHEPVQVLGPLGEHEAVPAASEGGDDVVCDLAGAGVVGDQVAVDRCDAAGCGGIGVAGVAV
jgi:hypothetical protein